MSAYVVVQIDVKDAVAYEDYKTLTPASILPYGGKFIVRGGRVEMLEGSWLPTRFVIVEFPSVERAKAWWNSPEYAPAKKLRQASAETEMIVVEGF
jgi:uncharacterized protein (DUF1330 family)